jgi:formylglycine-generating enzyme required for sulfatase activity
LRKQIRIAVVSVAALSVVGLCAGSLASSKPLPKSSLKIEMISIPAGSFLMGYSGVGNDKDYSKSDEHPQHSVTLAAYSIGKYDVTRGQYKQFMKAGGYSNKSYWSGEGWKWKVNAKRTEPDRWAAKQTWGKQTFTQTDNHPVVGVTYYEAEAFCKWAGGHLPTEAQWERAARWNSKTKHANVYPWGDVWDAEKCNNYSDHNSAGGGYQNLQTAPVGSYPSGASPAGCQDMAGNVWEWCKDWYGEEYYSQSPSSDPQGPTSGSSRVLRGGGWGNYGDSSYRCAFRYSSAPSDGYILYGFRLCRSGG